MRHPVAAPHAITRGDHAGFAVYLEASREEAVPGEFVALFETSGAAHGAVLKVREAQAELAAIFEGGRARG